MTQGIRRLFGFGYSRCSFCRKNHSEVARLIDGDKCFICNECVVVCFNLLATELGDQFKPMTERAEAIRHGAIEGELRWLKEQHENGLITESAYQERQQAVLVGKT